MKMFLTRMGQNAQFVVTGDLTQVDLPNKQKSGLLQAIRLLQDVPDAKIITLDARDVVRHPLVKKIIDRYEAG
jgi:phosphate starvation-inducible protein PhoH and related proteins